MNKRIDYIDNLKGFILLLICIGHIHINNKMNTIMAISTPFNMPTFFFISGLLFGIRRYNNFKSYYLSKKKSLLYPYIYLSLIFMLLDPRLWNFQLIKYEYIPYTQLYDLCKLILPIKNLGELLYANFINIFIAGNSSIISSPLWFVISLFLVSIFFYIIHKISKGNKFLILLYAIFCLSLGWICNINHIELPLKLATVFTTSFFFSFGYLSQTIFQLLANQKKYILFLIITLIFFPYLYFINHNGNISIVFNALGSSLSYFILSTLTGIFLIINIFILFNKYTNIYCLVIKGILKIIAHNALIILAAHYWAIRCCRIFLYEYIHEPWFPYLSLFIVIIICTISIPIFRNKLYWMIGKEKISMKESLSIK